MGIHRTHAKAAPPVKLEWHGNDLHAGNLRTRVAVIYYRASAYRVVSYLPGMAVRDDLNRFTTIEEAKRIAELVATKWFNKALGE